MIDVKGRRVREKLGEESGTKVLARVSLVGPGTNSQESNVWDNC